MSENFNHLSQVCMWFRNSSCPTVLSHVNMRHLQSECVEQDMLEGFNHLRANFIEPNKPSASAATSAKQQQHVAGVPVALLTSCGSSSDMRSTYARLNTYLQQQQVYAGVRLHFGGHRACSFWLRSLLQMMVRISHLRFIHTQSKANL